MKLVAVSQRVDAYPGRGETRDALDQRLMAFLLAAGYLPLQVPNILDRAIHDWLFEVQPAAVMLSGGNDIGQCPERDATEAALMMYAETRLLPLLGICRGMQVMAHRSGTRLIRIPGHVQTRHVLTGQIQGDRNSYHDYALDSCPKDYSVLARSEDGSIEAIGHHQLPWEGWMWHPEREPAFTENDIQRMKRLFA